MAAVTGDHSTHIRVLEGRGPSCVSLKLKSNHQQDCVPSGGSRGELHFLVFSESGGCPHPLALGPITLSSASIFAAPPRGASWLERGRAGQCWRQLARSPGVSTGSEPQLTSCLTQANPATSSFYCDTIDIMLCKFKAHSIWTDTVLL